MAEAQHSVLSKICTSCGEEKPATTDHFLRHPGGRLGLRARCIPCHREAVREQIKRPDRQSSRKKTLEQYRLSGRRSAQQKAYRKIRKAGGGPRCCIPECDRPTQALGWCSAHYRRWKKHGDPLDGRTPPGVPERFLIDVVLRHAGADCLQWPYARTGSGYGNLMRDGRFAVVSRLVCEVVHGSPPSSEHQAAHSCGKGHEGCVAPQHLSWKMPIDNAADKDMHGTASVGEKNGQARLSEEDVAKIVELKGSASQGAIAERFGVSASLVGRILRGQAWRHVSGP